MGLPDIDPHLPILTGISIEPLREHARIGGRDVFKVGAEFVFSNEGLPKLQSYPGQKQPDLSRRERFPIPNQVGEYCSLDEFENLPKYMAQWVHWPDRVKCVLEGRYHELRPAHFEGIFTLVCNFKCPHCSRRVTRSRWVDGGTWDNNAPVNERNTMFPEGLRHVIDQVSRFRTDGQMGIIWGGGDPTANPFTYDGMLYARKQGISASFLTNGVFLDVERVLDADPILVRISLNCGTEEAYRRFHGYPKGWDYFERVKLKMRELARRKLERRARTLIGISLIVDERNILDVAAAAKEIHNIVAEVGDGIDYVIARPVFNYSHFDRSYAMLRDDTKERAFALVSEGGQVWRILHDAGIPLILIKDSFEPPPPDSFYDDPRCLAYGICGEIRHNGDVQLCSDSYGNPEYTIGNLFEESLDSIWKSKRRATVLDRVNRAECYRTKCPHNSRGHHHNRVFHQIERRRRAGELHVVQRWIDDLRETTLPL